MNYFLKNNSLIYKDSSGHVKCHEIDSGVPLNNFKDSFVKTDLYNTTIKSISSFISSSLNSQNLSLIIDAKNFNCSGFIQSIQKEIGDKVKIQTDFDFTINSQKLQPGKYRLLDISENEVYHYDFEIIGNEYNLLNRTQFPNNRLQQLLTTKLPGCKSEALSRALFNFFSIISINEYISNEDVEELGLENFTFFDTILNPYLNQINVTFLDFFDIINYYIFALLKEYKTTDQILIIKSSILGFLPVQQRLNSNPEVIILNELDLLKDFEIVDRLKYRERKETFELNCYPAPKNISFPFTSWMLSERENLSFELFKLSNTTKESIIIMFKELEEKISNTFFSIHDIELVKYRLGIDRDIFNNLLIDIETLDKDKFFCSINTAQHND